MRKLQITGPHCLHVRAQTARANELMTQTRTYRGAYTVHTRTKQSEAAKTKKKQRVQIYDREFELSKEGRGEVIEVRMKRLCGRRRIVDQAHTNTLQIGLHSHRS